MMTSENKPLSIIDLTAMMRRGEKISCLTAYDASFAAVMDKGGVDILLVGDSLGMVIQGHATTLPVTISEMVYHTEMVNRGRKRAYLIADLPFMTYSTPENAAQNAARLMQEGGAQMVKLEGARIEIIKFLVDQGIPVCGHLGLLPQSVNQYGGYSVQGKDAQSADLIHQQARLLQDAGASLLVLECIPAALAKKISQDLIIPTIGIGAGADCDGQVLVLYDMLNVGTGKRPKFSKDFMADSHSIEAAIIAYHRAVKNGEFPSAEHSF